MISKPNIYKNMRNNLVKIGNATIHLCKSRLHVHTRCMAILMGKAVNVL